MAHSPGKTSIGSMHHGPQQEPGKFEAVSITDSPSQFPEARVLVVMTGGTICMRTSPKGLVPSTGFLRDGMAPLPSFNDGTRPDPLPVNVNGDIIQLDSLRTPPSKYDRHIRYTVYEFPTLLDSSSISSAGWSQIATTIKENYAGYDGFVILHGTDSLSYTSSALSFMLSNLGKPVILTGSQASIFDLQSDAVNNLLGSLVIAGTFMIPEVCLFFHHTLYRGNRTTKVSASAFEAFASPNFEPLAKVTGMGIDVNWHLVQRPTTLSPFRVETVLDTEHVACLRIFPGIQPIMLSSILQTKDLRGLILETFGAGNAPTGKDGALTRVIQDAVEKRGIHIVNISQCASGTVSPVYAPATILSDAGVIFGHDLTSEAALTKLSLLLALPGLSYAEISAKMSTPLAGEMTSLTPPIFSHPSTYEPIITAAQTAFAAFGYAIAAGDLGAVERLLEADRHNLINMEDYVGNTALHLAAVGRSEIVMRKLLTSGASVHVQNKAGNTPLWLAEKCGSGDLVKLLKATGALQNVEEKEEAERRRKAAESL